MGLGPDHGSSPSRPGSTSRTPKRHRMATSLRSRPANRPPGKHLASEGNRTSSPAPEKGSLAASRRLLSLEEAAGLLGLSVHSLRRLVWDGTLPAIRLTRRVQVDLRDLERLIERAKSR
jgi:excisionase family DNA binding protein